MIKYIPILQKNILFSGIEADDIYSFLKCLNARFLTYTRGEYVFSNGDMVYDVAILAEGELHIQKDDFWGNRSIMGIVMPGELFAESYSAPGSGTIMNDVVAVEESTVVYLNTSKILGICSNSCKFHSDIIRNLFIAVSAKNRQLVQKISHMSRRTTREKLLSYLSEQSAKNGSAEFEIPFNRRQLSEFLSVDRSAMSNELCKLRDEGLIAFNKSKFKLFQ